MLLVTFACKNKKEINLPFYKNSILFRFVKRIFQKKSDFPFARYSVSMGDMDTLSQHET